MRDAVRDGLARGRVVPLKLDELLREVSRDPKQASSMQDVGCARKEVTTLARPRPCARRLWAKAAVAANRGRCEPEQTNVGGSVRRPAA